eukprot:13363366-Alexandrium_andersonii.AAC.1
MPKLGRAGGASRGGPGSGAPLGKPFATQRDIDRTESIDGTDDDGGGTGGRGAKTRPPDLSRRPIPCRCSR